MPKHIKDLLPTVEDIKARANKGTTYCPNCVKGTLGGVEYRKHCAECRNDRVPFFPKSTETEDSLRHYTA